MMPPETHRPAATSRSSAGTKTHPQHTSYDIVIVGGAMMGSALAWHLACQQGHDGRILVIEQDPSYSHCSTAHSNSCIRQQFSSELNIKISQFGAEVIRNFAAYVGHPEAPALALDDFGYLYLAQTDQQAAALRRAVALQNSLGVPTQLLDAAQLKALYPWYVTKDILLASHNRQNEGYFDGQTMFAWWRKLAMQAGVEYCHQQVVAIERCNQRIQAATLAGGERIACGQLVNATGPRAAQLAAMAQLAVPIEPRLRYTFVFKAAQPLPAPLPLTVDPSGVHVRSDGLYYMAGCAPLDEDRPRAPDDFCADPRVWDEKVWPALYARIPQFDALRLVNSWTGHYAYNTLDQNAVIGPHPDVPNFLFMNGFSGHGLQQAAAMGRGLAEYICHGRYVSLDLSPFDYQRIIENKPYREEAVI